MLPAIAFVALSTMLPSAPGDLSVTNVRLTYGALGPVRPNANVLPGDALVVAFDIDGMKVDDNGKVRYSTGLELLDAKDKVLFKQEPKEEEVVNSLGGGSLSAFALVDIGLEQPAGVYTAKVTVNDLATKQSKAITQNFTVLKKGFGLVRVAGSADPDGQNPIALLGTGQNFWISASAVGFARDKNKDQPNLTFELTIMDDAGKPTIKKPFTGTVDKGVDSKANSVPVQFYLSLNRPGKFTAVLKVTDTVSGATSTEKYPLTVLSGGK
jgi:hypothetical protein